jgi:hypothetical protein
MKLARFEDSLYRVPGGELLWVELDGRTVGVHSREPYLHTDGTLKPGLLESWIRTDIRFTQFPDEGLRVRPLVCEPCGDTGQGADITTWGTDECESCRGYGDERNLHLCSFCGEFSREVLPVAPRETLNHELLLARAHPACAVESTVELVGCEAA